MSYEYCLIIFIRIAIKEEITVQPNGDSFQFERHQ